MCVFVFMRMCICDDVLNKDAFLQVCNTCK